MRRKALGKGLKALFPGEVEETDQVRWIPLELIDPNPYQPRALIRGEELQSLVQSIREKGLLQPIVVRPKGERFELVAGERRLLACREVGLERVPALVVEIGDRELLELALVENLQREDLSPIEEARAYRTLMEEFGLSQGEVAQIVAKDRSSVANTLRLLNLPEDVQDLILEGKLSEGHGRVLLRLRDPKQMREYAQKILEHGWSVRKTEQMIRPRDPEMRPQKRSVDPWIRKVEQRLQETLKRPVSVRISSRGKGRLTIEFSSKEDLARFLEILERRVKA